MAHGFLRRAGAGLSIGVVVLALSASAALAGEVTGSGTNADQNQGRSWCSFSGLNDKLVGEGDTSTMAQSYGQDVVLGDADPHGLNPGVACNPNLTFLPPNPNRTH